MKDYQAPNYAIDLCDLNFDLYEDYVEVTSTLRLRCVDLARRALVLDGQELELRSVEWNGRRLSADEFQCNDEFLTIFQPEVEGELRVVTRIYPAANTSLEGLYKSRKMFCTQCEAEGFRKITYYLDRPDVMTEFLSLPNNSG
ncbi:MAG: hypothetical protein U5O16_03150 [Rhodococcus sp. (in: high G+C Gram-positive bacteria)]|uniref:hypothetical protein n=1 Tax=Rhodococcus sp. TaxID=1831 RepID=UPI002ADA3726|nr:hypothetical protein [Rhodococcus sp. (in: high G+C Gram-positive bacteria)]